MKRFVILSIIMILLGICCQSCTRVSHNFDNIIAGKYFNIGVGDYGVTYANGLTIIRAVRENTESVMETNDGDGFGNPSAVVKGIRTIKFRTGPQISGYLKDLSKKNPEAALEYVKVMPELNKAQWDASEQKPIDVNIPNGGASQKTEPAAEPFDCSGDCELTDLWKDNSISYQSAVAAKLITYADDTTKFDGEDLTLRHSIEEFQTRLAALIAKKRTVTQMRVKSATIKNNKLVNVRYIMIEPDGNTFETNCPECVPLDE